MFSYRARGPLATGVHCGGQRQSDLYYNRARYYNPTTHRFLSEDPIGFAGGDSNLYRYVGNSPTNATDPSGAIVFLPFLVYGGLAIAAGGTGATVYGANEADLATGGSGYFGQAEAGGKVDLARYERGQNFVTGGLATSAVGFSLVAAPLLPATSSYLGLAGVGALDGSIALGTTSGLDSYAKGNSAGQIARDTGQGAATGAITGAVGGPLLAAGARGVSAAGVKLGVPSFVRAAEQAAIRQRVLANIAESQAARAASNFGRSSQRVSVSRTTGALPDLTAGYHYRSVGGRSVVVRNPGRAADLPQLHLDGNRLLQGAPPRTTGGHWDWANVRQRLGVSGWAESGQDVHHWLIPRNGWGGSVPDVVKNQKWNLMRMPSRAEHFRVHGWSFDGQPGYNLPTRLWRGTPTPAKLSVGGGVIVIGAGYYYFSE